MFSVGASCPEGSTGDNVPSGCTVRAGYAGTIQALSESPYYEIRGTDDPNALQGGVQLLAVRLWGMDEKGRK